MTARRQRPANRTSALGRWLRRGGYFTGWLLCVLLAVLVLVGGALWVAYKNPTAVAKLGIDLFAPDKGLAVGEVDLDEPGLVTLRNLAAGPEVRIDEVVIKYSEQGFDLLKKGEVESLVVRGGQLSVDDELIAKWLPAGGDSDEKSSGGGEGMTIPGWLQRLVPESVDVQGVAFELDLEGLPMVSGEADFSSDAVAGLIEGAAGAERQQLVLRDGSWTRREGGEKTLAFDELRAGIGIAGGFREFEIAELQIDGLSGKLTPDALAELLGEDGSESEGELPVLSIGKVTATGANLALGGFEGLPEVATVADLNFDGLRIEGGRLRSTKPQTLVLHDTTVAMPGAEGPPAVRWERVDLAAVPDHLFGGGWVERAHLRGLAVDVSERSLGDLLKILAGGPSEDDTEDGTAAGGGGLFSEPIKVRDLRIGGAELAFDPEGVLVGAPAVRARLEARNEGEAADGDVAYAFEISGIEVRENVDSEKPFARGGFIFAEFTALGLQRDGVIDSVTARGLRAEIGEAVQRLASAAFGTVEAGDPLPDEVEDDAGADEDEEGGLSLSIARLDIDDTVVTLRDLIPTALPYLPLNIDVNIEDVPLLGRSRDDERVQRVEVKGVQIASPYNSLQNAAELKTVWIHFTVAGLFRSEIKKVEIVSPDVYVGEPLFWYVDYARKLAAGGVPDADEVAAGGAGEAGEAGEGGGDAEAEPDAIVEGLKAFELFGWRVGEVEAHSGRIIIAPTGVSLGIVPFPFSAKTDFAGGKIELDVQVPTGDYVFEKLELEFRKLFGRALINHPNPTENNNFVQDFQAPTVRFKQFEASDVWMGVTYDVKGIYGKLYAKAYGGEVNSEFNIYVKGPYKWDAWISARGFDLGAFTNVLAPEQFKMSGTIDGTVVANGQMFDVEKATGGLNTRGGGTMHVIKLDDLRDALPEDWDPIWKAITEAGIDALRDYRFATCEAEVEYGGDEGVADILLDGEDGKRHLELRYFDRTGE